MQQSSLGLRMKKYEEASGVSLTPRMPMIIRIDGKAFHTYTKQFKQHEETCWSTHIRDALTSCAQALLAEIGGSKIAYLQSDEISLLVTDYDKLTSEAWFGKNIQKVSSVSASIATAAFNSSIRKCGFKVGTALFDSRCFVLPREEVNNYFVWRQKDAIRNSISVLAQVHFSPKQLHGKSGEMKLRMLSESGVDWYACAVWQQRGWCVERKTILTELNGMEVPRSSYVPDWVVPIFHQKSEYINRLVNLDALETL